MTKGSGSGAVVDAKMVDTRLGPVQCATVGKGAPVLVVHGTPGGYDQALAMSRFLDDQRFQAILPSRPGYLETELGDRGSLDAQADLLAAVLDSLDVERAGVLCWSGGGPPAYRLAVRHPDRVHALIACDCVSKAYPRPHESASDKLMFHTRAGQWLLRVLIAHSPKQVITSSLEQEGDLSKEKLAQRAQEVFDDPAKRQLVLDVSATISQVGRKAGYDNDIEQFETIDDLELERITAPSLIVHGSADTDVEPDHGASAAARIPNAELLELDTGTHFAFYTHPDADRAQARAIEYLAVA
jgi:pimeloyl-ACP methyl ester carboxylesterase